MDTELFRWVLLAIGFMIVLGIYLRERIKKDQHEEELEELQAQLQPRSVAAAPAVAAVPSVPLDTPSSEPMSYDPASVEPELPLAIANLNAWDEPDTVGNANVKLMNTLPRPQQPAAVAAPVSPTLPKEWLVVLNLMAAPDHPLRGDKIYLAAQKSGFEYGDRGIFHCFVTVRGEKKVLFSLANILEPGSFNLATMNALSTRGLTLFMQLPGPLNHLAAFDEMVIRARKLAGYLQVDIYDENHRVLTPEGLQRLKQQVLQHRQQCSPS